LDLWWFCFSTDLNHLYFVFTCIDLKDRFLLSSKNKFYFSAANDVYFQIMNKSVFKTTIFSVSVLVIVLIGKYPSAQIPLLDKLTKSTILNDTITAKQKISIDNVNKEIEYTDNLIVKIITAEYTDKKQKSLIQKIDTLNNFILSQGNEYRKLEPDLLTHFFLINANFSWSEYYLTLRSYQEELQKMIREIQIQQDQYIRNKNKWETSLPDLDRSLSEQIRGHINSNLKKLDEIIYDFDLMIRNLVTSENKIIQDILYTESILNDISNLKDKRRSELLKQNERNIFSINYRNSYSGSFVQRIKLAFLEGIKSFGYFGSSVKRNIVLYLVLLLLFIPFFFFVRKKYVQLNYNEDNVGFFRINRIIIQKPVLTLVAIVLILWTVFVPYSPLVLNLFLFLSILVILLNILSPVMDPFIKKVEIAVIILLTLSNLEILAWYFGNFSRIYLMLESTAGILLTYRFVLPGYKIEKFMHRNKELLLSVRIIIILMFIFFTVAFMSNIFGFLNLTVYSLKLGVYTGVISLIVHGIFRISGAIIQASVDVLNIYYPEIVRKYGNSIVSRLNGYLKLFLGFLWISGIFRISEILEFISAGIIKIFTEKVKIGSLSFVLGNMVFFIAILYFTYIIASFTKRIFEREILAKHEMKRGMAASISLTIRILLVFIGTLLALSVSGMDFGKIGIIAGALSVGIGFGLQNIVSNFISGLILVYEKPVKEGDTVEVDTLLGRVSNIGIRSSTIITYDGAEVVVPNSNLISNQLINWTLSDNRKRIEIKVGTSYNSDPHLVLKLLLEAALSNERVLRDPEPRPLFIGFGDNSLNFRLLFWVHFEEGLATQSDVALKIFDILKKNNIEIPFPQLDLHVKNPKTKFLNDEELKPD